MNSAIAINHYEHGNDIFPALESVMGQIEASGLDRLLYHLVLLRASQINGCGYCVRMHTREAREDKESNERLDQLIVWRHSAAFTPQEQAALQWTEVLTTLADHTAIASARAALLDHFSKAEITALTALVGMINLWNRIQISNH